MVNLIWNQSHFWGWDVNKKLNVRRFTKTQLLSQYVKLTFIAWDLKPKDIRVFWQFFSKISPFPRFWPPIKFFGFRSSERSRQECPSGIIYHLLYNIPIYIIYQLYSIEDQNLTIFPGLFTSIEQTFLKIRCQERIFNLRLIRFMVLTRFLALILIILIINYLYYYRKRFAKSSLIEIKPIFNSL